jgi:hypothetical protein
VAPAGPTGSSRKLAGILAAGAKKTNVLIVITGSLQARMLIIGTSGLGIKQHQNSCRMNDI